MRRPPSCSTHTWRRLWRHRSGRARLAQVEEEEGSVAVPVVWVGADELPVLFANQFVAQVDRGEVFLTVGQMQPPALLGTVEERKQQAEQLQFVAVKPIARIAMTPSRLRELISVLEITVTNYEQQQDLFGDPREDT